MVLTKHKKFAALSDRDLVRLFLEKHDQLALECLLARYENLVFSFIPKDFSQEDKEDILVECLAKISLNLEKFDFARAKLSTWVGAITKNRIVDHLRRLACRNKNVATDWSDRLFHKGASTTADEEILLAELYQATETILQEISPRDRKIISMRIFDQFKYVEIALEMNLPEETVKTIVFKKMAFLRNELKKRYLRKGGIFTGKNQSSRCALAKF